MSARRSLFDRLRMTHLCVPIFVIQLEKARGDIAAAVEAGADLIELRIDALDSLLTLQRLLEEHTVPVIVTCRTTREGGNSALADRERSQLLSFAAQRGAEYLDLELATFERGRHLLPLKVHTLPSRIMSFHDFTGRPERLYNIVEKLNQSPAEIIKIVWTAGTIRENLEALEVQRHSPKRAIAFCMGEAGLISRVLAKKFGAFLTFASLDYESATAPGQVTIAEMKSLYRWDAIKPSTKVFGVVAHPVRHSMSPAIHNAAFTEVGFDGIYLPMLVEPDYDSFKSFIDGFQNFDGMNLSGLSVTIPHKENALRYLKETGSEIEDLGERIGAINTISIERPGKLCGKNTDYAAILDSITEALGIDRDHLKNLRVAVLGAGGTGRAAVAALAHYGANVIVSNRTGERAKALAEEFKAMAMSLDDLCRCDFDVFVNTTSVGMYPKVDENPLADRKPPFSAKTLVFDTIYNPMKTRLLAQAEASGAKTIGGVEMFVRQAAVQFETWTGVPAPREVMRRVIISRLGS
jgi:3-dehydroquinate dehydratase / shikimate dehydrogenase